MKCFGNSDASSKVRETVVLMLRLGSLNPYNVCVYVYCTYKSGVFICVLLIKCHSQFNSWVLIKKGSCFGFGMLSLPFLHLPASPLLSVTQGARASYLTFFFLSYHDDLDLSYPSRALKSILLSTQQVKLCF